MYRPRITDPIKPVLPVYRLRITDPVLWITKPRKQNTSAAEEEEKDITVPAQVPVVGPVITDAEMMDAMWGQYDPRVYRGLYTPENPRWAGVANEPDFDCDGKYVSDGYCHWSAVPPSDKRYSAYLFSDLYNEVTESGIVQRPFRHSVP